MSPLSRTKLILSSLSLLAMLAIHANPVDTSAEFEVSSLLEEDGLAFDEDLVDEEDDDLAFEDEAFPADDLDTIDQEILVLEEELKKDAEGLQSSTAPELVIVESPAAEPSAEPSSLQPPIEMTASSSQPAEVTAPVEPSNTSEPVAILPEASKEEVAPVKLTAADSQMPSDSPNEAPGLNTLAEVDSSSLDEAMSIEEPATLEIADATEPNSLPSVEAIEIDLQEAFAGAPIIYSILLTMSVIAFCIWLYNFFSLKKEGEISEAFLKNLKNRLNSNHFDDALSLCLHHENLFSKMVASGINTRRHGLPTILESMKAEGKRASVHFWQRISLLNDIAVIAPMLGLLGTVLGMFYAFYDLNRSIESISSLFDGLGVSVGTTVAGLIVAILALILHSIAKYRLVKMLAHIESEAQSLGALIDNSKNCL